MIKEDKQKKKMKMMNSRCSSSSSSQSNDNANAKGDDHISNNIVTNNNAHVDDDFVVYEILVRLPVKTLMRFKSVCKRWMSSIHHDPQFHHLHYNHSERQGPLRILVHLFPYRINNPGEYQVLNVDNLIIAEAYHTFRGWENLLTVNGLACVLNRPGDAVRIYNRSTRQETQWIKMKKINRSTRILFGFDPVTKKHKVLRHQRKSKSGTCHEVLTVGDNLWRRIDHDHQVPNKNLCVSTCVYVNGAIYWMEKISRKTGQKKKRASRAAEVLVAFDVGSEKFRVIPIPDSIINQPRDESYWYKYPCAFTDCLLEVDGRVALLRRIDKNTVSMWILEDGHDHNRNWTEVVIKLPFDWDGIGIVNFINVPCKDQIILIPYRCGVGFVYSYNWKNNTSKKLTFNKERYYAGKPSGDQISFLRHGNVNALFLESLFPVM